MLKLVVRAATFLFFLWLGLWFSSFRFRSVELRGGVEVHLRAYREDRPPDLVPGATPWPGLRETPRLDCATAPPTLPGLLDCATACH